LRKFIVCIKLVVAAFAFRGVEKMDLTGCDAFGFPDQGHIIDMCLRENSLWAAALRHGLYKFDFA